VQAKHYEPCASSVRRALGPRWSVVAISSRVGDSGRDDSDRNESTSAFVIA
jgi:hypothetical protein